MELAFVQKAGQELHVKSPFASTNAPSKANAHLKAAFAPKASEEKIAQSDTQCMERCMEMGELCVRMVGLESHVRRKDVL